MGRGPLTLFVFALSLGAQIAPAGLPALAGAAHSLFHLWSPGRTVTAAGHAHGSGSHHHEHAAPAPPVEGQVVHSHGPNGVPHAHAAAVDRVMALAEEDAGTEVAPVPSAQVDHHVPPSAVSAPVGTEVDVADRSSSTRLALSPGYPPPAPPPKA